MLTVGFVENNFESFECLACRFVCFSYGVIVFVNLFVCCSFYFFFSVIMSVRNVQKIYKFKYFLSSLNISGQLLIQICDRDPSLNCSIMVVVLPVFINVTLPVGHLFTARITLPELFSL